MNKGQIGRLVLSIFLLLAVLATGTLPLNSNATRAAAQATAFIDPNYYLPIVGKTSPLYDWLQFNGDGRHTGSNMLETRISAANVTLLHVLFQIFLPAIADGAPVYLSNVETTSGLRNLIFITTRTGDIVAFDASTGTTIWTKSNPAGSCLINNSSTRNETCYTTSSPAVDPNRLYVYSYGLDGYVHKYAVGNGSEIVTGGWPELASRKVYDEKGSSALGIATAKSGLSYLYVTNGGYPGDAGNYQGHVTAINLSDGTQKVFNALCSNQTVHFIDSRVTTGADCYPNTQVAIWARPGVIYDPATDRIYMATGNGDFTPGSFRWGETVFALHPDGTGAGNGNPLDSYTPVNFQSLTNSDTDLGSTAPALLPVVSSKYPHLAVQGGKDALVRILNLDNMSGQSQVGKTGGELFSISVPMGGEILTQPAVWVNPADQHTWVFVSNGSGIAGLQLVVDGAGNPSLQVGWWKTNSGTSPIVANGVLFYAHSLLISALNPTTGALLWSNNQIGSLHWQSPVVVNGVVYIEDEDGRLNAFSLP
jgi:hypothetical protein